MGKPMMCLLNDLFKAIEAGRKKKFKQTIQSLQPFLKSLDTNFTAEFEGNPFKDTNLVILCCKFGQMDILDYILSRPNDKQFIECFFNGKIANLSSPLDEDGEGHDAFYYAIRSNNIEIVKLLLMKWLQSFESVAYSKDFLLSQAYENLKLRNVRLTEEMEFFVESEIITSRFISNSDDGFVKNSRMDLLERIDWFLSTIDSLGKVEAESTFLVLAKCVAQNMNILKQQLKATYETLPWEELEFCLISYIIPKVHPQEKSILPLVTITKETLLSQLGYFATILRRLRENDLLGLNEFPNMSREEAESKIKQNSEEFIFLYEMYKKTRDMYSWKKIGEYLKLSLSANHKEKQGQLSILRVLHIIGDYLKNTLDNTKFSTATSRVIMSALPVKTRNIVIDLRNTVCHSHSLQKRFEIEENNSQFFLDVQTDLKRLSHVLSRIMTNAKLKMTIDLLEKITKTNNVAEIRELAKSVCCILKCAEGEKLKLFEEKEIRKLISELEKAIPRRGMSCREVQLFEEVMSSLVEDSRFDPPLPMLNVLGATALHFFKKFKGFDKKLDAGDVGLIKMTATIALRELAPTTSVEKMAKVLEFARVINEAIRRKLYCFNFLESDVQKMKMILFDISFASTMNVEDVLCHHLAQNSPNSVKSSKPFLSETERNKYLNSKLVILKSIIGNEVNRVNFSKQNENVTLAIELLLLDILTISTVAKCEPDNSVFYIENYMPLLVGDGLRNYLAHESALLEIFSTDITTVIQLNAFLFLKDEISTDYQKNRKVCDEVPEAKEKLRKNMQIVTFQGQLFHALEKGDSKTAVAMIKSGADVCGRSISHESSLHFAVRSLNIDICKFIVEQKMDVNSVNKDGQSSLHIAAALGNIAMVKHLIENGADLKLEDKSGRTPLHEAAKHGCVETVALLLKLGADALALTKKDSSPRIPSTNVNNAMGFVETILELGGSNFFGCGSIGQLTPLHVAAKHNRVDVIKLMLKKGVDVDIRNPFSATPLIAAAESGSVEAAKILIKAGAKVNTHFATFFTALHLAADQGHAGVAAILLQNGAEIDPPRSPARPIHFAAAMGQSEVVKLLIQRKANFNHRDAMGATPLHLAAQNGHVEVIRTLIEAGVNIQSRDERGITALQHSVSHGKLEATKFLIEKGAELNAKGPFECTALHLATEAGYEEIGEILVKSGAKVDARRSVDGCTPLILAIRKKANSLVKVLLENGANPELKNKNGMAPVHAGATLANFDGISYLLKFKCNVNQRGFENLIPLHFAAGVGDCKVAELLLKNGANVNATYEKNFTPLYAAVEHDRLNMVRLLLSYGADTNLGELRPAIRAIDNNSKDVLECIVRQEGYISKDDTLLKAVSLGYTECVRVLLEKGCSVHTRTAENRSALHFGASTAGKMIVSDLLLHGADVNSADCDKNTPLHYAVIANNYEVVEVLVSSGADVHCKTKKGYTALHIAIETADRRIIEFLLAKGADPLEVAEDRETPLSISIRVGDVEKIDALFQGKRLTKNVRFWNNMTPLHLAAGRSLEVFKYLINRGYEPNPVNDIKPIHAACIAGKEKIVEYLLDLGVSVNEPDFGRQTPLHYAACHDKNHLVKYLVSRGANVNAKDREKITPLILAAQKNDSTVKFLFENGALFNEKIPLENASKTYSDVVNLHLAVKNNNVSEVKKYINMGTVLNAISSSSGSPLHFASCKGYYAIVKLLLEHNANANVSNNKGCTPLHYAAKHSHEDIVLQLLIHGAVYNALTDGGSTALSLATDKKIKELLSSIGKCFDLVEKGDVTVEAIIKNMGEQDVRYIEALINTRNQKNQDILALADVHKYPKLSKLYEICHAYKENVQGLHSRCLDEDTQKSDSVKSGKHKNSGNPTEKQSAVVTAAIKGDFDSLKKLLQRGCNVNETDNNGRTALHFAVNLADEKCVQFLLQNGADVTQVSHKGNTALHTAVNKQCEPIVKMLLEFALNNRKMELINTPTLELGNTALHVAAKNGSLTVAKILLKYGAIYEIKNRDAATPMDLSSSVEVFQFFTLLREMFVDAKTGNFRLVTMMKSMTNEDVCAVAGARNEGGRTIVQVALGFEHKNITTNLIRLIQAANAN